MTLPHRRFHRHVGEYASARFDYAGNLIATEAFESRRRDWFLSDDDLAYLRSIMKQVIEPGKVANWIAPPLKGIGGQDLDYEYVKL